MTDVNEVVIIPDSPSTELKGKDGEATHMIDVDGQKAEKKGPQDEPPKFRILPAVLKLEIVNCMYLDIAMPLIDGTFNGRAKIAILFAPQKEQNFYVPQSALKANIQPGRYSFFPLTKSSTTVLHYFVKRRIEKDWGDFEAKFELKEAAVAVSGSKSLPIPMQDVQAAGQKQRRVANTTQPPVITVPKVVSRNEPASVASSTHREDNIVADRCQA